ncbi:MAG: class I SAM-dependent methyltransferase [Bdellovibrionales bacterium]|nr:class I SAM-dependent methyltransferase [Bdellovibrionales bacterium]
MTSIDGSVDELSTLLKGSRALDLSPNQVARVLDFYRVLLAGNARQNLTRLTTPMQFFEGHLLDVVELHASGTLQFPAADWGSGCGVPGLLYSAVYGGDWVLVESEKAKAAFLAEAVEELGLSSSTRVYVGRGEDFLKKERAGSLVARAVGPVERFWGWAEKSSTWNNLVLLKAKSWDQEWDEFKRKQKKSTWQIQKTHAYEVGPEKIQRKIVSIVPRGTNSSKQ